MCSQDSKIQEYVAERTTCKTLEESYVGANDWDAVALDHCLCLWLVTTRTSQRALKRKAVDPCLSTSAKSNSAFFKTVISHKAPSFTNRFSNGPVQSAKCIVARIVRLSSFSVAQPCVLCFFQLPVPGPTSVLHVLHAQYMPHRRRARPRAKHHAAEFQ